MIRRLSAVSTLLCFCVVVLGAFVRLSDAGLGCPDWPGCYGLLDVPQTSAEIADANAAYPQRPVEVGKAWKEMIHRYLATVLGFLILVMAVLSWRRKDNGGRVLPTVLLGVVIAQGVFGALTVTLLLKPIIVTIHLIGGLTTLSLLVWLTAEESGWLRGKPSAKPGMLKALSGLAFAALALQIFLGGWTSTNYAAMACPDFPTCQGRAFPPADFDEGFTLWRGLDQSYEYGVLDSAARTAIHLTHRYWAIGASLLIGLLAGWLLLAERGLRLLGAGLLLALTAQVMIGISTVLLHLPLGVATAHNAGAAVLLALMILALRAAWLATPAAPANRAKPAGPVHFATTPPSTSA